MNEAVDPADPDTLAVVSNAVTVTVIGDPDASLYWCVGVESDVATVDVPSPQSMVYLMSASAVGVVVIVSVTLSPNDIEVESAVKVTDLT